MNSQGISSLNYRTFQTIACKRLLISDYREELSRNIEVMMQYNLHMNQNAGNINRNNLIQKSADILLKSFEIK